MSRRAMTISIVCSFAAAVALPILLCRPAVFAQRSSLRQPHSELALSLIRRVIEEEQSVSFRATQTVILWCRSGTNACITNVVHQAPDLTRTEYLPSAAATSSYRVVVSDGSSTWHYEPSLGVVFHMSAATSAADTPEEKEEGPKGAAAGDRGALSLIEDNYDILLTGTESLAGRMAHVIEFRPRHPNNPSRKIWVDAKFPFILRMEKYRPDGIMSSLSFYNQIEFFPAIDDSEFEIEVPSDAAVVTLPAAEEPMALADLKKKAGFIVPTPEFVPAGYVLEGGMLSRRGAFQMAHICFTDGLNTISYFVAPRAGRHGTAPAFTGMADRAGTISLGPRIALDGAKGQLADYQDAKLLRWHAPGYEFTLIGEVDESLLVEMARSVQVPQIPQGPAGQSFPTFVVRFFYQLFWIGK